MKLNFAAETDSKARDAIVNYFTTTENPNDDDIHALSDKLGVDTHEFEKQIYTLLSDIAHGKPNPFIGKHSDVPDDNFDPKELKMGIAIEQEHTPYPEMAKAIAKDHLTEIDSYYTLLKQMESRTKK